MTETPLVNIKAVAQETGIKEVTIRSWERRYGLPNPARNDAGHRRYSPEDIDIVKWLAAKQEAGITISEAVEMWHTSAATTSPVDQESGLQTTTPDEIYLPLALNSRDSSLNRLRESWLQACKQFDRRGAEQALTDAFSLFPAETVCVELLQKGMAQLGRGWDQGEVTILQEHFASALTLQRLEMLIAAAPPPHRPEKILIGCAPDDHHTFMPMLLTFLLRRAGFDVIYLGANVAAFEFEQTLAQLTPQLVIISAQRLHTAAALKEVAEKVTAANVLLAYGGSVFNRTPLLRARIPGYFLGQTITGIVGRVEEVLAQPLPPLNNPTREYQELLARFKQSRALIEAYIWGTLAAQGNLFEHLPKMNEEMDQVIVAALKLGDIHLLGRDLSWLQMLLISYPLGPELLGTYVQVYHQAAVIHLGSQDNLIVDWLHELAGNAEPAEA